jgi:hypothetical protein
MHARIIVQCFLERLPFDVLEDHTVWIATNKTVHSMGSIEGREGACGQAAAGVKGKASKPSWNRRPYPCRSTIGGISPAVGQRDGLRRVFRWGSYPHAHNLTNASAGSPGLAASSCPQTITAVTHHVHERCKSFTHVQCRSRYSSST